MRAKPHHFWTGEPVAVSVTVTTRSAFTSSSDCRIPEGQRISISRAAGKPPRPKRTLGSLDAAEPVLLGHDKIGAAIVIEIAIRQTTMARRTREIRAGSGAGVFELPLSQNSEDGIRFRVAKVFGVGLDVVHDVAAGHEQILPAVVIQIGGSVRPTGHSPRQLGQPAPLSDISEVPAPKVPEQRKSLILNGGVPDVRQSVIIHVAKVRAHARELVAVLVVCHTSRKRLLLELLAAQVVEQKVGTVIVGNEDVHESVAA